MATFKTKLNTHDIYEWARLNPHEAARRIMGWDVDAVAMFNVIEAVKTHCLAQLDFEAGQAFEEALRTLGWGKKPEDK